MNTTVERYEMNTQGSEQQDVAPVSDGEASEDRRHELLLTSAVGIVAVILTLVGVEVAFRVLGVPFKVEWVPSETTLAQFDSALGWVYIPNSSKTQTFGTEARPVPMHFDEIGARAASRDRTLDHEAPTIILVGGSYTFGQAVPYEETFAGQLESMTDSAFQIVNLGVQAFGTDQALLRLQRHFHEFNTKAVVYTFINDHVSRNENYDRRILIPTARFIGTKPRFALQPGGGVVLDKKPILLRGLPLFAYLGPYAARETHVR